MPLQLKANLLRFACEQLKQTVTLRLPKIDISQRH